MTPSDTQGVVFVVPLRRIVQPCEMAQDKGCQAWCPPQGPLSSVCWLWHVYNRIHINKNLFKKTPWWSLASVEDGKTVEFDVAEEEGC